MTTKPTENTGHSCIEVCGWRYWVLQPAGLPCPPIRREVVPLLRLSGSCRVGSVATDQLLMMPAGEDLSTDAPVVKAVAFLRERIATSRGECAFFAEILLFAIPASQRNMGISPGPVTRQESKQQTQERIEGLVCFLTGADDLIPRDSTREEREIVVPLCSEELSISKLQLAAVRRAHRIGGDRGARGRCERNPGTRNGRDRAPPRGQAFRPMAGRNSPGR